MDEGLNFSDIFDDDIPYEQKPPEMYTPMEEMDYPIQAKDLFAGLWESNLLTETHLQDLYHATNELALLKILKDDAIKLAFAGGTEADEFYNKGYPYFLSTMRSKYGTFARGRSKYDDDIPGHYNVVIHLDGSRLKDAGFKMYPVDYWAAGPEYSEQEERIVSNKDEIRPLFKFIKDIHVYVRKDLEHPRVIDALHQASQLAPQKGIKIYFYPPGTREYFWQHRTEKAVTDVSKILKPAVYSPGDLEYIEWRKNYIKKYGDRKGEDLESFMRIYRGDYSKTGDSKSRDERTLRLLRYYPRDAYASLMADVHNYKKEHIPIFREIVAAMKKEGVKTFRDLITIVIEREAKRLEAQRDLDEVNEVLLKESDELHFDIGNYDYNDRQSIAVFLLYPEFDVWYKRKNNKATFYSTKPKLQKALNKYSGHDRRTHGAIRWVLEQITNDLFDYNVIPQREYGKEQLMFSAVEQATGRVWGIQGKIYISFWQTLEKLKPHWNRVEKLITSMGYDPQKSLYLFGGAETDDKIVTYNEVKSGISKEISNRDRLLRQLLHLSPEVKKAMILYRVDKLQAYADELGMTVAELRQKLGSMDETRS